MVSIQTVYALKRDIVTQRLETNTTVVGLEVEIARMEKVIEDASGLEVEAANKSTQREIVIRYQIGECSKKMNEMEYQEVLSPSSKGCDQQIIASLRFDIIDLQKVIRHKDD